MSDTSLDTWLGVVVIAVQVVFCVALLRLRDAIVEWMLELRRERRAYNAAVASNQYVVDWLTRYSGSSPNPPPFTGPK